MPVAWGCCNISVLLLMVLEPIGRAGAVGEPVGGTRHCSGKAFGFPTPQAVPKSSWLLSRVQGNWDPWALGQAAQRMEQSSEST